MKKLILNQETLRNLTEAELRQVVGAGNSATCLSICHACGTVPPLTPACP